MYYHLVLIATAIIVPLAAKLLKALGIGAVMYIGINLMLDQVMSYIQSQMGTATILLQQMLGVAKIDVAINIIFAAVTTKFVMQGMNAMTGRKRDYVLKA